MTLAEILKNRGLAEDAISGVLEDMKTNKIFTASEENLDIRYGKLKSQHDGVNQQLTEANNLIEELKKSSKGQEGMQQKITEYEARVKELETKLEETRMDAAIRLNLTQANALDVDYLLFKLKEKAKSDGKPVEMDENGTIKGWDDILDGLQKQSPSMFPKGEDGNEDGYQIYKPNKLKDGDGGEPTVTKERFRQMGYEERLALKQKNEKLFHELSKA